MKRIVSVVLISALLLTGCRQTPENSADSKLYVSINGENLQGIKEVVQKKNVDLENMDIKARGVEKRALEAAISADAMDVEMLQMLVDAGAEVNIKDDNYLCEIILNADIPYSRNLSEFNHNYLKLTKQVSLDCSYGFDFGLSGDRLWIYRIIYDG